MKNTKILSEKNLSLILVIGIITIGIIVMSMSGCISSKPQGNETINETANNTIEEKVMSGNVTKISLSAGDGNRSEEYISVGDGKYPFENDLIGMKVGDKKNVSYDELVAVRLTQEPKKNTVYMTSRGEIKVFNVTETEMFVGNKLAGETLNFSIKIKSAIDAAGSRKTCLLKYNVSADTVAFYHSTSCPHCVKMMPWVQNMENITYKFLWIEGSDNEKMKIAQECLADVLNFGGGVPQFGCPSNGKLQLGEFMSIDHMKNFSEECKNAAKEIKEEPGAGRVVNNGDMVEVEYIGKLLNGEKFDEGAIKFAVGSGQMIKGFDEAVVGMKINESKNVTIPPEKAYGFPEVIPKEIPEDIPIDLFKQVFNEEPVLNKEYSNVQAGPWPVKVIEIKTENYNYSIEILDILTKEEYRNMSCLGKYGISEDTIAFYHSNSCPHCVKMKPWVQNLESSGYKFLWIEGSDNEKVKIAQECLANVLNFGGGVPQFGCPSNGKLQLGEFMSIDDMKKFADECRNAVK